MNRFSDRGGKVSLTMGTGNAVAAAIVTLVAVYGSFVARTYASFWRCRISHNGCTAFLRRSSRHHLHALYPLAAIDTHHATHPYHSILRL